MIQAPKGDLTASIRELGRTRIEVVPRDSTSVFVHWEVADTAPDPSEQPSVQFRIDLVRESNDAVECSLQTSERVGGEILEVTPGDAYYAVLNLITPQHVRLARSSTIAAALKDQSAPEAFVVVHPGANGLKTTATEPPADEPIEWSWEETGSSPK